MLKENPHFGSSEMSSVESSVVDRTVIGIVETIADQMNSKTTDIPPLQHFIDVQALTSFIENSNSDTVYVKFDYCDHVVTVDSTGHIEVETKASIEG